MEYQLYIDGQWKNTVSGKIVEGELPQTFMVCGFC